MKKYLLPLLVSILGFSAAAIAQNSQTIEGRVLMETENLKLVELPNHRQAVYFINDIGEVRLLGQVGKIRAGTEFFHWGNGTPEQAEAWDKAGQISPELLNRLKVDKNFGALGGGFYASLSRVDSMSYGNVQIVLRIPKTMRIILNSPTYGISGDEWVKVVHQLEKFDISALQNRNQPTWFNIIDAEALTKEHVAKAQDWSGKLERSAGKGDIIAKFPDIYTTPSTKIEIDRYLYYWKALASPDQRNVYAAFKYFSSIKDTEGINYSLALINPVYKDLVLKELITSFQTMNTAEKANLLNSSNLRSSSLFPDILKLAMRETAVEIRQMVYQLLMGKTDPETTAFIKAGIHDANENIRRFAYYTLYQRKDSEALEILRQGVNDSSPDVRALIMSMASMIKSPEGTMILRKGITDQDPRVRTTVVNSIYQRRDQLSLEILKIAIRDSNNGIRGLALNVAMARQGMRSLDILRSVMNGTDNQQKAYALSMLKGRNDSDSLKILMSALKDKDVGIRAAAITALGTRKERFTDILATALKDSELNVRYAAIVALTGRTDSRSLDLIVQATRSQDVQIRIAAINALSGRSDSAAVRVFKNAMKDEANEVRQATVLAAKNLKGQDFTDIVTLAVADYNDWVRVSALKALRQHQDDFSFETLKTITMDKNEGVRYMAMQIIAEFKAPTAIDYLKDLMNNSTDPRTQYLATSALQSAGHQLATAAAPAATAAAATTAAPADTTPPELTNAQKFNEKLGALKSKVYEAVKAPRCEAVFRN